MAIYTRRGLPVKRDISHLNMSQVVQEETPVAPQAEEKVEVVEETPQVEAKEDSVKKEKK